MTARARVLAPLLAALIVTVGVCAAVVLLMPAQEPDEPDRAVRREGVARGPGGGQHASGTPGSSYDGLSNAVTTRVLSQLSQFLAAVPVPPRPAASTPAVGSDAASPAVSDPTPASPRDEMWERVAQCETGGDWSMTGPTYSGGVGFANGSWDAYGGREFADLAGHASREQQIIVAERIYADNGYKLDGAWGCDEAVIG